MKIPQEKLNKISINKITKLGKDEDNKPTPVLVRFGHRSERNEVLFHSRNLEKEVNINKKHSKSLYEKIQRI